MGFMGITIVQKSDLSAPRQNAKTALVLAGGAVSGGAFKLGGMLALNRFMINRNMVDFDIYVGISAGSIIAVCLANGITIEELIKALEGKAGKLLPIKASAFYAPNYKDFIGLPFHMVYDLATWIPKSAIHFFKTTHLFNREFRETLLEAVRSPNTENLDRLVKIVMDDNAMQVKKPSIPWNYIPTGLFTTEKMEKLIRKNIERNGSSNDFRGLYKRTGKALYIVAMNLDTAERTIFGHDHLNTVPISRAVQASIAVPLFYKPVTIGENDYVDGAVAKTTSIDLAIAKGADLVICYNPFRPFNHEVFSRKYKGEKYRMRIATDGIYAVLNQVMRTVLHTRLMSGIELRRKNPDYKGDIILVEPSDYDDTFFDMNPLAFWERKKAIQRGYESVKQSISKRYDLLTSILNAYGIDTSPKFISPEPEEPVSFFKSLYENLSF